MLTPIAIALILNGLTLTVALGLLIIILWYDSRRITNLYFAWFLLMVTMWSAGSIISRAGAIAGAEDQYVVFGLRLLEMGFTSSALAIYLYVVILIGNRSRFFQFFAVTAIILLLGFHLVLYALDAPVDYDITADGVLQYAFTETSTFLFTIINVLTLGLVWQRFRKIQRATLAFGIMLFSMGQLVALLSPRLRVLGVAEDAGSIATLVMAFAQIQAQVIQTLAGQNRQIEVVRDVGLIITSRLRLQTNLPIIAKQVATLLGADASVIFLKEDEALRLVAHYQMHDSFIGEMLGLNEGLAGKVATEQRPYLLNDYRKEWKGVPDTPFAFETFGSVVAVPLIFIDEVVGVLLVIGGLDNRLFEAEDLQLLELLSPQAAVAISNGQLFEQQQNATSNFENAKRQLEAVLLSTDNPVIAVDKRFNVIFANQAAEVLLEQEELTGQNLVELVGSTYLPPNPRQLIRDLKRKRSHIYELDIRDHTYLCHLTRMEEAQSGWVAVLNDVTSLKELERLQRQMIELTTHQLKNPLTGAMMHLELLQDDAEDILNQQMKRDLEIISQQHDRMYRLIEGILNLERIENRNMHLEALHIGQLVRDVMLEMQDYANTKKIVLESEIPAELPIVAGDPDRLSQAVNCLVDNAIKYTPPEGEVKLSVAQQNAHVTISVCDTGIGIPLEAQAHVFERFYRAEQPGTEQVGGTGMGLSLVKAIVESHNGQVWLESKPNQGTTFYISLPHG